MSMLRLSTRGALLMAASISYGASADPRAVSASPPVKCEIQMAVWCVREGAKEIVSQIAHDAAYRRAWIIRGFFQPHWPLIVLEPHGCREGLSDAASVVGFAEGIKWGQQSWNRIRVRLKDDRSCDLDLLVPHRSDDPSGEAFFGGMALIQACRTSTCDGPSLGSIRGELEQRWRAARPNAVQEDRR